MALPDGLCGVLAVLSGPKSGKTLWPENALIKYLLAISLSHTAIVAIVGGYALFFLFKGMKIRYSPVINTMARTTFEILMIHDRNFFRSVLWKGIIRAAWYYSRFLWPVWGFPCCFCSLVGCSLTLSGSVCWESPFLPIKS